MHKWLAFVLIVQHSSIRRTYCVAHTHFTTSGSGNSRSNNSCYRNDIRKIHIVNRNEMYANFITFHQRNATQLQQIRPEITGLSPLSAYG